MVNFYSLLFYKEVFYMKKTVKFLSLLLALGLIAGCNANKPSEGPKSEDKSVESSKESFDITHHKSFQADFSSF